MATILHKKEQDLDTNWELSNDNYNKEILLATIFNIGGDFGALYENPMYFKYMSDIWFEKHRRTFQKWFDAFDLSYNPIENYSRKELTVSKTVENEDTYNRFRSSTEGENTHDASGTSSEGTEYGSTHDETTKEVTDNQTSGMLDSTKTDLAHSNEHSREDNHNETEVDHDYSKSIDTTVTNSVSAFDAPSNNPWTPHDRSVSDTDEDLTSENTDTDSTGWITRDTTNDSNGAETNSERTSGTDNTVKDITHGEEDSQTKSVEGSTTDSATDTNKSASEGDNQTEKKNDRTFQNDSYTSGNIGVTTSQQMLTAEIQVQMFDIYNAMAEMYVDEMCVRVYLSKRQRGGCPYGY